MRSTMTFGLTTYCLIPFHQLFIKIIEIKIGRFNNDLNFTNRLIRSNLKGRLMRMNT
jgi:hypothetical protein